MAHHSNVSLIILAGGKSERMGFPKVWLRLKNKKNFAEQILSCYQQLLLNECVLVLNADHRNSMEETKMIQNHTNLKLVSNYFSDKGRLFSIRYGMSFLKTDYTFIHNIDQPHIDSKTLELLIENKGDSTIVIPRYKNKGGHPVLIGKNIVGEIKQHYAKYNTLKDVFANFDSKYIDVTSPYVLTNINTPDELNLYQKNNISI